MLPERGVERLQKPGTDLSDNCRSRETCFLNSIMLMFLLNTANASGNQ